MYSPLTANKSEQCFYIIKKLKRFFLKLKDIGKKGPSLYNRDISQHGNISKKCNSRSAETKRTCKCVKKIKISNTYNVYECISGSRQKNK